MVHNLTFQFSHRIVGGPVKLRRPFFISKLALLTLSIGVMQAQESRGSITSLAADKCVRIQMAAAMTLARM